MRHMTIAGCVVNALLVPAALEAAFAWKAKPPEDRRFACPVRRGKAKGDRDKPGGACHMMKNAAGRGCLVMATGTCP
jgi:hypothetical protein